MAVDTQVTAPIDLTFLYLEHHIAIFPRTLTSSFIMLTRVFVSVCLLTPAVAKALGSNVVLPSSVFLTQAAIDSMYPFSLERLYSVFPKAVLS